MANLQRKIIAIIIIASTLGVLDASNDSQLRSKVENITQPTGMIQKQMFNKKDGEILNEGLHCWHHCPVHDNSHQAPCPNRCGKNGICCATEPHDKMWSVIRKDNRFGCGDVFNAKRRHLCLSSICTTDKTACYSVKHKTFCEETRILINTSISEDQDSTPQEIWCLKDDFNCKVWIYSTFAFWLAGVISTTIAIAGFLMNLVLCYVLSLEEMRNVFNSLLIALAIFDNLYLLLHSLLTLWLYNIYNIKSHVWLLLFPKFLFPLQYIAFWCSIFMIVAISMERYNAVTRPISVYLHQRNNRKAQVIRFMGYLLSVFISSVILNIPRFFYLQVHYNEEAQTYRIERSFDQSSDYIIYYLGKIFGMTMLIMTFAIVLYLNFSTYITLRERRKNQISTTQQCVNSSNTNVREDNNAVVLRTHFSSFEEEKSSEEKMAMIFLTISLLFLICHFPRSILLVYELFFVKNHYACVKEGYIDYSHVVTYLYFSQRFFQTINSSVNSAIYCVFSSNYRKHMKKCLNVFRFLRK